MLILLDIRSTLYIHFHFPFSFQFRNLRCSLKSDNYCPLMCVARKQKSEWMKSGGTRNNLLVRLIETIFCKRNIREQYKGYYRNGVRMVDIYIFEIHRGWHRNLIVIGNSIQLDPIGRCQADDACRKQDSPCARSSNSRIYALIETNEIFIRVCIDHALLTLQVEAGGSEMDHLWRTWSDWWWSRGIPRLLLNIFWRVTICGLSIFICWMLRIEKCVIETTFWIIINYKDF